jgi:hypothetical protein
MDLKTGAKIYKINLTSHEIPPRLGEGTHGPQRQELDEHGPQRQELDEHGPRRHEIFEPPEIGEGLRAICETHL